MKVINEKEFKDLVENHKGAVLVDFFATWCGPCRMLSPILEEVQEKVEMPIYKVDVDECENLAKHFGILSIPTMIVFVDGVEQEKINGLRSCDDIVEILSKLSNS